MDLDQGDAVRRSEALDDMANQHAGEQVAAGQLVLEVMSAHRRYIDEDSIDRNEELWADFSRLGASGTVLEHLAASWQLWDNEPPRILTGRRVILAMAMDPRLGWVLLRSGVIASLLALWRPKARTGEEPDLVAWDMLSEKGRTLADEQPLLATALGAPSEWAEGKMIDLPEEPIALAWSPSGDRLAILAQDVVYEARPRRGLRRLDVVPEGAVALGWTNQGVVALCRRELRWEVRLVPGDALLGDRAAQGDASLSGDGLHVWLNGEALECWAVNEPTAQRQVTRLGPASLPLAVDWAGTAGVVEREDRNFFVSRTRQDTRTVASPPASSEAPSDDLHRPEVEQDLFEAVLGSTREGHAR